MGKEHLFYRYIYKRNNGYQIQYKNEHYGWYPDLPTALYDRDRLEQCDWNMSIFVELPELPVNPYEHMDLPPFDKTGEYIVFVPARYRVVRKINGKQKYYGTFKSLDEAREVRDYLEATNGW